MTDRRRSRRAQAREIGALDALRGKNCNKHTFLVLALADRVFALERGAVFHEDRPRRC